MQDRATEGSGEMTRAIVTTADADSISEWVERVFDRWFAETPRIDWEEFLDRLELSYPVDVGEDWDSPAIHRIKHIVQQLQRRS